MDNSITAKKSVQKHDGQGALAGIRPSRLWTLGLLWTGWGCQSWTLRVLLTLQLLWTAKQNVQKLDGQSAMAGIRASRVWTLALLWTVRGCPELDARGALDM